MTACKMNQEDIVNNHCNSYIIWLDKLLSQASRIDSCLSVLISFYLFFQSSREVIFFDMAGEHRDPIMWSTWRCIIRGYCQLIQYCYKIKKFRCFLERKHTDVYTYTWELMDITLLWGKYKNRELQQLIIITQVQNTALSQYFRTMGHAFNH